MSVARSLKARHAKSAVIMSKGIPIKIVNLASDGTYFAGSRLDFAVNPFEFCIDIIEFQVDVFFHAGFGCRDFCF